MIIDNLRRAKANVVGFVIVSVKDKLEIEAFHKIKLGQTSS